MDITKYMQPNGYYNTQQLMEDAGLSHASAFMNDFYGDSDQGSKPLVLPEPFDSALREARAHNDRRFAAHQAAKEAAARQLMAAPEPWPWATWERLKELGYAVIDWEMGEDERPTGAATLSAAGERLRDPQYVPAGLYDDATEETYIQRAR